MEGTLDWIKIKTRHIFHDGFNKTTLWAWVRIMGLVAELEMAPSERQMLAVVTKRELKLLSSHLESEGKLLSTIIQKVLEDAQWLKHERKRLKQYRAQQSQKNDKRTSTVHVANAIREDILREDTLSCSGSKETGEIPLQPQPQNIPENIPETTKLQSNELLDFYQREIHACHPVQQIETTKVLDWLKTYPNEWIKLAITEAVMNNKKNFKYINAILSASLARGSPPGGTRPEKMPAEDRWAAVDARREKQKRAEEERT